MKTPAVLQTKEGQWVVLGLVALVVVYYVVKQAGKAVGAAATAAGGLVSGNNALTQGTPYQGAGIAGTLGAAANTASGGLLSNIGDSIGSTLADWFQPAPDTAAAVQGVNRNQVVTPNNISDISSSIGGPDSDGNWGD